MVQVARFVVLLVAFVATVASEVTTGIKPVQEEDRVKITTQSSIFPQNFQAQQLHQQQQEQQVIPQEQVAQQPQQPVNPSEKSDAFGNGPVRGSNQPVVAPVQPLQQPTRTVNFFGAPVQQANRPPSNPFVIGLPTQQASPSPFFGSLQTFLPRPQCSTQSLQSPCVPCRGDADCFSGRICCPRWRPLLTFERCCV